ncbi:hypothetical protein GCM10011609_88250 [Lentzea pudingi]|uniref:Pyoverdine/dityrosine biosynthesis protein Dit1 n=1 Tax=Lentzea pudingi TaxID=1789439 RepID=A0ABQ2IXR0_9PSEU|nr:hypothetical protein GCM10011609_88250 [Lentzea pudingi]
MLSLRFLDALCERVGEVHPPGARLIICSDGHIFGDVIGVPDNDIDAYSDELKLMIEEQGLTHLSVFDLRNVFEAPLTYDEKRAQVVAAHGPSVEEVRSLVKSDDNVTHLYRGITRFLVEDTSDFAGSKSALQRDCRRRAYGVIQRSTAWGELVAAHHPRSVRLSIHPQPVGAVKFGIRLLDAEDAWTTPWHSVLVVDARDEPRLMRRDEAEMVAELVRVDDRPSHFRIG